MDLRKKISLIGDPGVGKTSLVRRFVYDEFDDRYLSTMGMKVTKKVMNMTVDLREVRLTLQIWDTMGQHHFKPLLMKYFRGSEGAFIVSDLTTRQSLDHASKWAQLLFSVTDRIPLIFLANKLDLRSKAAFSPNALAHLVERYGHSFLPTSAKTGENVEAAFDRLAKLLIRDF